MRIKTPILALLLYLIFFTYLYAEGIIEISGLNIPLIEGARVSHQGRQAEANATIVTYTVEKPLAEVIRFYETFLKDNAFLLMGGEEEGGFNASVKKGNAMFTLKVYAQDQHTLIQFIW